MQTKHHKIWLYCFFLCFIAIKAVAGGGCCTITLADIEYSATYKDETQCDIFNAIQRLETCPVCLEKYSDILATPLTEIILTCNGHHAICSRCANSIQSQHNKYECPQCRTIFNDVLKASDTDIKYIPSVDPLLNVVFLLAMHCSQLECCTCHQTVSVVDAFDGKHQCLKQDPPSPSVFQTVESGEKPLQCSLCQKYYKTATSLASHISASHSGEHTCTRCQPPVTLKNAMALANHNRSHHRRGTHLYPVSAPGDPQKCSCAGQSQPNSPQRGNAPVPGVSPR